MNVAAVYIAVFSITAGLVYGTIPELTVLKPGDTGKKIMTRSKIYQLPLQ